VVPHVLYLDTQQDNSGAGQALWTRGCWITDPICTDLAKMPAVWCGWSVVSVLPISQCTSCPLWERKNILKQTDLKRIIALGEPIFKQVIKYLIEAL